ncbi:MAG: lactonase family protein [Planctomycetaceae bacterium]|jgi:6-phosphogluconolactonase|nr:lactonase family protein [Planctomycetaceae bacterium]MBT6154570.1 lactonase family protein [Planctomycetaceae bacterium]MBT6487180.1 lactonase family protein [Planctomycetaceae bacterium]MBT6497811.1 lactonase family protein [Planctomycetaceae bacterium]
MTMSDRHERQLVTTFALAALLLTPQVGEAADKSGKKQAAGKLHVYVGTYTRGESEGVYVSQLDLKTGKLSEAKLAAKLVNPSFVSIHPSRKFVYAVGEINDFQGKKTGGVSAFAVNPKTGQLKLINQQSSEGTGPCHLVVDATGKNVLVANYGGGSVACLPVKADGSLAKASSFHQHEGSSVNPQRQKGPHAHSINVDAGNRFAMAADLGLDKVLVYRFDAKKGTLTPNDPPSVSVKPGGGPRHFAFHPNGKFAFTNNEITLALTAFRYDAQAGTLKELQTLSTLPKGTDTKGLSTAEVRVHPNGKFVYVSNRGHDTIAIFKFNQKNGKLKAIGHVSTGGKTPRNFNLDPSGRFALAANQDTHNVVVFRVNQKTGQLTPTGSEIKVFNPVCIRFMETEDDS